MEEMKRSNPRAAQVRIESRQAGSYTGQRKHDLRIGAQPAYVDADRAADNETVIEPPRPAVLREINESRRAQRDTKRAMKSNAAVAFVGILTFGTEAQAMFEALPRQKQREAFEDAARAVADRLNTTLVGLVIHRDETAPHAHFTLPAYDMDGHPLTKTVKRATLSDLQDVVASAFQKHAPAIERGRSVAERAAAGATRAEMVHKSVRELHADLPAEIHAKRAEVAEAEARVIEMRGRVLKLEEKETLTAAEVKRLATYRKRLEDRLAQQEAAQVESQRLAEVARTEAAQAVQDRDRACAERDQAEAARVNAERLTKVAQAEAVQALEDRDKARAEESAAKAKAVRIAAALHVLTEEIKGETIGRGQQGQVVAKNPQGLKDGFPDLKPAVIASADAMSAKKRIQAEAVADRESAAVALKEAEQARHEAFNLRAVMKKTVALLKLTLSRVGRHLTATEKADAAEVVQEAERLITPPKKPREDSGSDFSM